MIRLIRDLAYEPVLLFTVLSAGLVTANEILEVSWLGVATVVVVAVGGVVTRHYTSPTLRDQ